MSELLWLVSPMWDLNHSRGPRQRFTLGASALQDYRSPKQEKTHRWSQEKGPGGSRALVLPPGPRVRFLHITGRAWDLN